MRRIVYCPDDSMMQQAENLAKKNNLPINVGFFDGIKNLINIPNIATVIEIPEDRQIYFDNNVKQNFHQNIVYINDFLMFDKNLLLSINNIFYKPILIEKHKIVYNIYESILGLKQCNFIKNNEILESFEYNVY